MKISTENKRRRRDSEETREKMFRVARECTQVVGKQFPNSFPVANPQQLRNKLKGQKSVVSCRFPNSVRKTCCQLVSDTTCCGLVGDIVARHVKIVCCVTNKSATSWQLHRIWGKATRKHV